MAAGKVQPEMKKEAIRQRSLERLSRAGVRIFPTCEKHAPNFRGAENAATLVSRLTIWRRAKTIKFDLAAPQIWLRRRALEEGKVIYLATTNLCNENCFIEIDPARLGWRAWRAVSLRGALNLGRRVTADQVRGIDMVVTGAVALNRQGAMVGPGGGSTDLHYGVLRHLGKVREYTPVVTTVHSLQITDDRIPMRAHDVPFDFAATPENVIAAPSLYPRPRGVLWDLLPDKKSAIPAPLRRKTRPSRRTPGQA